MYTPVRPHGAGQLACRDSRPCPPAAAAPADDGVDGLFDARQTAGGREREETGRSWPGGHARGGGLACWTEPGGRAGGGGALVKNLGTADSGGHSRIFVKEGVRNTLI